MSLVADSTGVGSGDGAAAPGVPGQRRVIGILTRWRAIDVVAVVVLAGWAIRIEALRFWEHNWIAITWGDWAAHAYRAEFFNAYGLINWDTDWNNGLPLFQGYQTGPHILTAWIADVFKTGIPHSMMIETGLLLVLVPISGYLVMRSLGLGAPGALLGAALLLDNADIGSPIQDFSYLFGFALLPILVAIVVKHLGHRGGYLGAILIGLSPNLHPYVTVVVGVVAVARLLYDRRSMLSRALLVQLGIAASVSSFYWLPFLESARPRYQDPWNYSIVFEQSLMARSGFHGLSIAIIALSAAALVGVVLYRRYPQRRLTVIALLSATIMAGLVVGSYVGAFPQTITAIELVRLMPVLGGVLAFAAAPLGDLLWTSRRRLHWRHLQVPLAAAGVGLLVAGVLVEGRFWFHEANVPVQDTIPGGTDLARWAAQHPSNQPLVVLTTSNDLAFTSYNAFGRYHFPGDYIVTRQWTEAEPVLNELFQNDLPGYPAQTGDFTELGLLMRVYGVRYVFLNQYAPSNVSFVSGPLAGKLRLIQRTTNGWIAEVPWTPVLAFTTSPNAAEATTLPNLKFLTADENAIRQAKLQSYVSLAYSGAATPASITWHTPLQLTVQTDARGGEMLVVPENWDTVWTASTRGRVLPVQRVGPNFIGVTLSGLDGPVTVTLTHGAYATWVTSGFIVGASGLFAIALWGRLIWVQRRTRRRQH